MSVRSIAGPVAVLATLLVLTTLLVLPDARADARGTGALDGPQATVSWSGKFRDTATPFVELCAALPCDTFAIEVRLPGGAWTSPGGVLVAVEYGVGLDVGYDLDLVVLGPDGERVAGSEAFAFGTGEATLVPSPANGLYTVVIVPKLVVGHLPYRGFASISYLPAPEPLRELLPNFVALEPRNVQFATGTALPGFLALDRGVRGPSSCYPHEIAEQGALRCLRFDQRYANLGEGPVELRYRDEADGRMRQRVYRSDGTFADQVAGAIEFHASHAHFHYAGFAQSFLHRANPDGSSGELVRAGEKSGFCMADVEHARFGGRGGSAKTYLYPGVCDGSQIDAEGPYSWAGLSVGWSDVYPWFLADQYVEVSGVPDGTYVLEFRVNQDGGIVEASADDNAASVLIALSGDSVEVVG